MDKISLPFLLASFFRNLAFLIEKVRFEVSDGTIGGIMKRIEDQEKENQFM